jgi:transposase-like protein
LRIFDTTGAIVVSHASRTQAGSIKKDDRCSFSQRENSRNGYRTRSWDIRAGSIERRIPKLRSGSYFPCEAGGCRK